jgi:hypothetical protein
MKKLIAGMVALVIAAQGLSAQSADFEIKDGVLVKYNGSAAEVIVPEGVTSIESNAFSGNKTLVSITLPASLTSIGAGPLSLVMGSQR